MYFVLTEDDQIEAIEQQIVSIQGKARDLNFARNRHHRATIIERNEVRAAIMDKVHRAIPSAADVERVEAERCAAVAAEREERYDALEAERQLENERKRTERRQDRQVEVQQACERRRVELQERQWDVANRFRNEEVSVDYRTQAAYLDREKKLLFRQTMVKQMAERRAAEEAERKLWTFKRTNETDDAQFFELAQKLLDEADSKKKPLYPLRKCVEAYRRRHDLTGMPKTDEEVGCFGDDASGGK